MASLVTHLCASLFLLPIGLRRLFCSSSLYLKNTSLFRSKTWCLLRRFDEEGMLIRKELGTETLTSNKNKNCVKPECISAGSRFKSTIQRNNVSTVNLFCVHGSAKQGKYTSGLVAGLSEEQCQCRKFLL
ncbi:PREDICTED: uncharacterized protein LOC105129413 isoform X1 [Populus euphratica]|uniref:Uncharacterized protein LOC105129413 isoform X1 n=1 Tax=Populus euphratica TaxID=75702 RepID=A0AAJ6XSV2_POPEU|nr:PREDICTED: uncharacterized protein LOC105129413 isoform X1 [Populus euphratica]